MKYTIVAFLLILAACGDSTGPEPGVDLTSPGQLVGSYRLAVYAATADGNNPGGSLNLRADSTFTLSVNTSTAWSAVSSGRWSWTGGNVQLKPARDFPKPWPFNIYGSIESQGLGFTAEGYPALFFRKM